MMKKYSLALCMVLLIILPMVAQKKPIRLAVAGLVHCHIGWILSREAKGDVELVGIVETNHELEEREAPYDDPFALFATVINQEIVLGPYTPYSLGNNIISMEILDAAVKSAKSHSTIQLKK